MAKGNMLQGMSRGKVGDVVFSRLDGEQIARVRNRHPKNPKTAKQLYQRAIMATVMQAYSAGIAIFDHSFEGFAAGAACQRRFMSVNAKKLREQLANDINESVAVASQVGRVVGPGVSAPTPCVIRISEGTLEASSAIIFDGTSIKSAAAVSGETVANYCSRLGLVSGDIITIVGFVTDTSTTALFVTDGSTANYGSHFPTNFFFARLIVKDSALTSGVMASEASIDDLFTVDEYANVTPSELTGLTIGNTFTLGTVVSVDGDSGCWGIIRSRLNEDLRSTADMVQVSKDYGIATQYALAAWQQGATSLGDSDLILEGGDD